MKKINTEVLLEINVKSYKEKLFQDTLTGILEYNITLYKRLRLLK
jgi:hypothetical protein